MIKNLIGFITTKFILVILSLLIVGVDFVKSQDIHFSQFYHSIQYINPSFMALPLNIYRFSIHCKNQWMAVTKPYQTYLSSFDVSFRVNKLSANYFSAGALIYHDIAGDANLSLTKISPFLSYTFSLDKQFNNLMSCGIQPSFIHRSLDFSKLYFDSQYDGFTFNENRPSNEQIFTQNYSFADFGIGLHYIHFINRQMHINGGLSLFNITKPKVSFKNNNLIKLDRRSTLHGSAQLPYKSNYFLPAFYFASQGPHKEFIIGSRLVLLKKDQYFQENIFFRNNFLLGLFYRIKDAVIVYVGYEIQNFHLAVTYDINLSKLTPASYARGGFELSLSYIWQPPQKPKIQEIPCPIF